MGKTSGTQCCALGCRKRWKKGLRSDSEGSSDEDTAKKRRLPRTYHSIPSDPERRKRWLFLINREDWIPSKYSRVCSDHFFEKHMDRTGQSVRLRENAAPLRFKMLPQDLKKSMEAKELQSEVESNDDTTEVLPQGSKYQASLSKWQRLSSSQAELEDDAFEVLTQNSEDEADFNSIHQNLILSRVEVCDILEALPQSSRKQKFLPIKNQKLMHDHAGYCLPSAIELKKQLEKSRSKVCKLQRKIKTLQQQSRRLKARVSSFKGLAKLLRSKNCISGYCEGHLDHILTQSPHMI